MMSWTRNSMHWLRVAVLAVVLGIGLNSIAQATHQHDAATDSAHHLSCGYCVHFGSMVDAPRHSAAVAPTATFATIVAEPGIRVFVPPTLCAAQPRAPPFA
jgi:hypothetical protein